MIIIDTPDGIEAYRLLVLHKRMKLELIGVRFKLSTFGAVRREFGLKGNRVKVLEQYETILKERGILQ